ncbi:NHL domain-containing protein [Puia dinghuensis]|uniref:NHL domain-containing protein n=1 Tax=Puia dinghuensis TaxID=1792502 RepID=UPI0016634346|nr:T9SS type A sorting domain-containing protein [Puia dinghuensis]
MKIIITFLILLPQFIIAQNITTVAGTGAGGYNGDGISAVSAQLQGPQGLALDASGNLYIADLVNSRIRKVDIVTGTISTVAGTGTAGYNGDGISATAAQIASPSALAFDGAGDLYFSDRANNRVRKITISTGIISTIAGTGTGGYNGDGIAATAAQLNWPNEVSFDAGGNLYIADWVNHRVRKVDKLTGIISTVAGTGTGGYNGDGIAATAAQINAPCGIVFDNTGNIYIGEYGGQRIRKITISTGIISTIAGTGTAGYNGDGIAATTAQLHGIAYIKFDGAANMYIGDAANQRVREINAGTGIISTIAGTGTAGYNGDGIPATTAQLNLPFYILFDTPNCNMYIGDYVNNRVRKITGGFTGCTPLPLQWLSFTGKSKDSYNFLEWQTVGGTSKDHVEIERSKDSRNFEAIGVVNEAGDAAQPYSYSFVDRYPLNGINYYRLIQTDNDGKLTYSQIIAVTGPQLSNLSINIYPNPGNGQIRLTSSDIIEEMKISNLAGQIVYHRRSNEKNLSLQLDKTGVYFIQITTANQTITKKITLFR